MCIVNAISKVRFSSLRPQRIRLAGQRRISSELLCLEAGQSMEINGETEMLYAVLGQATLICEGSESVLQANHLAAPEGEFRLKNHTGQRFVAVACRYAPAPAAAAVAD